MGRRGEGGRVITHRVITCTENILHTYKMLQPKRTHAPSMIPIIVLDKYSSNVLCVVCFRLICSGRLPLYLVTASAPAWVTPIRGTVMEGRFSFFAPHPPSTMLALIFIAERVRLPLSPCRYNGRTGFICSGSDHFPLISVIDRSVDRLPRIDLSPQRFRHIVRYNSPAHVRSLRIDVTNQLANGSRGYQPNHPEGMGGSRMYRRQLLCGRSRIRSEAAHL